MRYLAWNLGSKNIRVNAISAGPIKTLAARGVGELSEMMRAHAERAPLHRNVDQLEVGGRRCSWPAICPAPSPARRFTSIAATTSWASDQFRNIHRHFEGVFTATPRPSDLSPRPSLRKTPPERVLPVCTDAETAVELRPDARRHVLLSFGYAGVSTSARGCF